MKADDTVYPVKKTIYDRETGDAIDVIYPGLTVRDHIAIEVLCARLSNGNLSKNLQKNLDGDDETWGKFHVKTAYQIADEMIAESEK